MTERMLEAFEMQQRDVPRKEIAAHFGVRADTVSQWIAKVVDARRDALSLRGTP